MTSCPQGRPFTSIYIHSALHCGFSWQNSSFGAPSQRAEMWSTFSSLLMKTSLRYNKTKESSCSKMEEDAQGRTQHEAKRKPICKACLLGEASINSDWTWSKLNTMKHPATRRQTIRFHWSYARTEFDSQHYVVSTMMARKSEIHMHTQARVPWLWLVLQSIQLLLSIPGEYFGWSPTSIFRKRLLWLSENVRSNKAVVLAQ